MVQVGEHGCEGCKSSCPASNWSATQLKNHRNRGDPLICQSCITMGRTVRDSKEYPCKECGDRLGRTKYDENNVQNHNKRGAALTCKECKSKFKCRSCKKLFPPSEWTADQTRNHKARGDNLVCASCRQDGCTPQDPDRYKCNRCKNEKGTRHFDKKQLKHFKYEERNKLICTACEKKDIERVRELQTKLKASRMRCKCGCLFHKDRCPLVPVQFGERRWPGKDTGIGEDDRRFLDSLHPKPKWWSDACRKPS